MSGCTADHDGCRPWLDELYLQISTRFARSEPRHRALSYLHGLVGSGGRPGGRSLAGRVGDPRSDGVRSDGVQRLLTAASWDEDLVRDDVRAFVLRHLGQERSVLCAAETGFAKRGDHSAAVGRQFCQETRRVENCQLGLFLLHSSWLGQVAAIDRELYLPRQWESDRRRRTLTGIDGDLRYRSKIELVRQMVARALEARLRPQWVVVDLVGDATALRTMLERSRVQYLIGVGPDAVASLGPAGAAALRIGRLAAATPTGAKGWRQGARPRSGALPVRVQLGPAADPAFTRSVLVQPAGPGRAVTGYHLCYALREPSAAALDPAAALGEAAAAARCWYEARHEVGLDHYEVRSWRGWYRHVTLAMAAHAAVQVARLPANQAASVLGRPSR